MTSVPLRILATAITRRTSTTEPTRETVRVGAALAPTFVFSLVMAQMLAAPGVPTYVPGGLILFTILNAFVPQVVLARVPMPVAETEAVPVAAADPGAEAEAVAVTGAGADPVNETKASTEAGSVESGALDTPEPPAASH